MPRLSNMVDVDKPDALAKADEASRLVIQHYLYSKRELIEPNRDKWKEWYNAYRCYVEIADDDLTSNLCLPLIFSHVESYLPRLIANMPRVEVWGRGEEDSLRAAQHRALLFYDWEFLRLALTLVEFVKAAEIYGTAFMKVDWSMVKRKRVVRRAIEVPQFVAGIQVGVEKQFTKEPKLVTIYDNPVAELLELDEVYPDPGGKNVDDAAYMIHRTPADFHALKAARKDGNPLYKEEVLSELEELLARGNPITPSGDTLKANREEQFGPGASPYPDPSRRQVHLLEEWQDGKVVTVVEEYPQLRPIRNDYNEVGSKPFVRFTPVPDPNSMYGIALPEVLYSIGLEMNTLHNTRLDNVLQGAHRVYSVLQGSLVNPNNIRQKAGGHFYVGDHDEIKERDWAPIPLALYREEDSLRLWAQQASGATDTFQGLRTAITGNTATEAALLAQASGSRAGLIFKILSLQSLKDLGRKLIALNTMNLSDERFVRIAGESLFGQVGIPQNAVVPGVQQGIEETPNGQFLRITPEELLGGSGVDLDLILDVAETEPETRQIRLQRAVNALQVLSAFRPPDDPLIARFLVMAAEGFGIDRGEELIQQGNQLIAQQRAIAQAQEQAKAAAKQDGRRNLGDELAVSASADAGLSDGRAGGFA